ncbi:unnamed protein product [Fraxinus pennsylvanica]|uniref:Syringolide-induced protein 14-1-1 n=1 Tax=Fraxinus pennsylvanica TaxID=56036 RepID=A0AAD1YW77_9LAMI|nr:unnamed protein product [Fraxinus pennsylvanica]
MLKFLPKALSFQNPPFSPAGRRDNVNANNHKSNYNRGFSGPIISIIPAEARGRKSSKNSNFDEPTSPKVSCMGQIKHRKNKISKKKQVSRPETNSAVSPPKKKPSAAIRNIFSSKKPAAGRKSDGSSDDDEHRVPDHVTAPSLNQMKKFASSRDTFANFDWTTAQIAPENRGFYSDEEGEDEIIIPFSAPILRGGGGGGASGSNSGGAGGGGGGVALEPRKEINIWKRRTMAQPQPLQLNTYD